MWTRCTRATPAARIIADRHYNRQSVGAPQFVPPGRCLVLLAPLALWVTSWPFAEFAHHAWAGAWMNSAFRREGGDHQASDLIRAAVAATRWQFGDPPTLGMVSFVDAEQVRHKRDPGRCYLRAGFRRARCPQHETRQGDCAACDGRTKAGLLALQLLPEDMPPTEAPLGASLRLWSEAQQQACRAPGGVE